MDIPMCLQCTDILTPQQKYQIHKSKMYENFHDYNHIYLIKKISSQGLQWNLLRTDFFPFLILTNRVLKQGDNIDLCFKADKSIAGRRRANHGIVSRDTQYCSAAYCKSKEPLSFMSKLAIWKGRKAKVIALAVIKNLSSVCAELLTCEGKGASSLLMYLLIHMYNPLFLLPKKCTKSLTAISASWRLLSAVLFHTFTSIKITRKRIARDVRATISWTPWVE